MSNSRSQHILRSSLILFFQLTKIRVTIPVSVLTFIGFYSKDHVLNLQTLKACCAIFLLAGAASALNQLLEKKFDGMMSRTQKRPIPSGKIHPRIVLIISILLVVMGMVLLASGPFVCIILSIFNLAWYLGLYTYLKRITALAVIPGSVTGAVPVIIGWTAAGGSIFEPLVIYMAFYVFMCQIPHFWLLILIYGKEYQMAGYPTLFKIFNEKMIQLWTMIWISAAALVSMFILNFNYVKNPYCVIFIVLLNLTLIGISFLHLVYKPDKRYYKKLFHINNFFMLLILLLTSIGII
jgi:heme o synthase